MSADPKQKLSPAAAASWKKRLQHVSLQIKIVVPMVALAVTSAISVGGFAILHARRSLRESTVRRVEFDTASKARAVEEFVRLAQQDLTFLSRIKTVRDLARAETLEQSEQVARLRGEVEREFLIFAQSKRAYYQVRYLNAAGHEVVRLNVENGQVRAVPTDRLQDKSGRYYVQAALELEPGQLYVSPADLNVEFGKTEVPYRSVVRYATPVVGRQGLGRGLLVINVYVDYLLSLLGPLPPQVEAWLIDEDGVYLGYVGDSDEKRKRFSFESGRRLSQDSVPEEDPSILTDTSRASGVVESGEALLSSAPISFDPRTPTRRWTLRVAHERLAVEAPVRHLTVVLSIVMVLVVAVASFIGVLVARHLSRPVERLRRATREIAADNLQQHVEITTGDEIEELANDFNAMTDRLCAARERLSAWNEELEREVARQTERLQRLQSGLARVDKLASIGQMTAAVMHEIGNPLAAIKAKIQVTQEGNDLTLSRCQPCLSMMDAILHEVNRLATFLHTFSRLARLRQPEFETICLVEVVNGVVGLVTPELEKKGVRLRVEVPADRLTIHGNADQLRQILINLILNAEEASPRSGEVLVRVRRLPHTDDAAIEVIDQGTGMSQETMDQIWEPFFTTKREGTGLGLAICRRIVDDHGGTIRIRSTLGEGTVVTATFSVQVGDRSPTTQTPNPTRAGEPVQSA